MTPEYIEQTTRLHKKKVVKLLGPNGIGKGTLADGLVKMGITTQDGTNRTIKTVRHVSTGEVARADEHDPHYAVFYPALENQRERARKGELMDPKLMSRIAILLINNDLIDPYAKIVLVDGYPRTPDQNDFLNKVLDEQYRDILDIQRMGIFIDGSKELVQERTEKRNEERRKKGYPLRSDDTPEAVEIRYDIYLRETYEPLIKPLLDSGEVKKIAANQPPEDILHQAAELIFDRRQHHSPNGRVSFPGTYVG